MCGQGDIGEMKVAQSTVVILQSSRIISQIAKLLLQGLFGSEIGNFDVAPAGRIARQHGCELRRVLLVPFKGIDGLFIEYAVRI